MRDLVAIPACSFAKAALKIIALNGKGADDAIQVVDLALVLLCGLPALFCGFFGTEHL